MLIRHKRYGRLEVAATCPTRFGGVGKNCLVLLLVSLLSLQAVPQFAYGVIVLQKGENEGIRGVIVRKDESQIVVKVLARSGKTELRTIPRAQIEEIIETVDKQRLSGLKPSKPESYSLYAEELSDKRNDLEAREMGIRLFLIAAHLDPNRLGRSSLLGMTRLSRSSDEERRFRAMVYLLDTAHDRSSLQAPQHQSRPVVSLKMDQGRFKSLLKVGELIRKGEKRTAQLMIQRPPVRRALARYGQVMTAKQLENIASTRCSNCKGGKMKCTHCNGTGRVAGTRRVKCPRCMRGTTLCNICFGNYVQRWTSRADSFRLLTLELAILKSLGAEPLIAPAIGARSKAKVSAWSKVVRSKQTQKAPTLTLQTITEFDPRLSVYNNGKWGKP